MKTLFKRFMVSFTMLATLLSLLPVSLFAAADDISFRNSSGYLNFAEVNVGDTILSSASLYNKTSRVYELDYAQSSIPAPFSISPYSVTQIGAQSLVNFTFSVTPTQVGTVTRNIGLVFNATDGSGEYTKVEFEAQVVGTSDNQTNAVTPDDPAINFGTVAIGSSDSETITFTNHTGYNLEFVQTAGNCSSGVFRCTRGANFDIGPNSTATVTYTYQPTEEIFNLGSFQYSIRYSGTSIEVDSVGVTVTGTGSATAPNPTGTVTVSPSNLSFGTLQVTNGQLASATPKSVTLTNTTTQSVTYTTSNCYSGSVNQYSPILGISCFYDSLVIPAGGSKTVSFYYNANSSRNDQRTITFTKVSGSTNAPSSLAVNVSGAATVANNTGTVTASPTTLNFGSVDVTDGIGNTADKTVTFTNTTNQTAYYTSSDCTGLRTGDTNWLVLGIKCFYYTNSSTEARLVIPANSSKTVTFSFNPQNEGSYSKNVTFSKQSGASQAPSSISITASGTAVKDSTSQSNENLIRDLAAVYTESSTIPAFEPLEIEFRVTENAYVTLQMFNSDGDLLSEGFTNRYYSATSSVRTLMYSFDAEDFDGIPHSIVMKATTSATPIETDTDNVGVQFVNGGNNGGSDEDLITNLDGELVDNGTNDRLNVEFDLNEDSYLTLELLTNSGSLVTTVFTNRYFDQTTGVDSFTYSLGRNLSNTEYRLRLSARSAETNPSYDTDTVTVDFDGNSGTDNEEDLIRNFTGYITDNGTNDRVTISFLLAEDSDLTLKLYNRYGSLIDTVFADRYFNDSNSTITYTYSTGRNLTDTQYRLSLEAETTNHTPQLNDTDTITVNFYNGNNPNPNPPTGCDDFADVDPNSTFCSAVDYVVSEGIITGDFHNGVRVIRQNDPLTRAEAVTIMMRAIEAQLDSDLPLAFYDVDESQYYAPYLRKAVELGAIHGYPNGTFQPGKLMTRAEFYKAFLRAVKNGDRANYFFNSDIAQKPFTDTNLEASNVWYLPYADWARRYFDRSQFALRQYGAYDLRGALIPTGEFKPGEFITRGHIIELIHEMHLRNLAQF